MNYSINNNAINNNAINNNAINNLINNAVNNAINNIYNNLYYNINNAIYNSIINTSFYEDPIYKNVISEEEFNKLEKKHYSISSPFNNTCPITQIEFLTDEEIIELPCNHCFNPTAIKKWLMEEKGECPVCRYKFETVEQPIEEQPIEEQPIEEQPIEEQPIEEQTIEENLIYNPNDFNDVYNNFMDTYIIYLNII
jgi:hypothetical protein